MSGKFLQASVVIKSLRDSGYNNAASALGELIDNSIQAGASIVELGIIEEISSSTSRNNFVATEITLWDNGKGMSKDTLGQALQFGGGEHRNDKKGMGKFGMGLPNSSISQCKRVEVWSWQDGLPPRFTYLDVDEMASGLLEVVPEPEERALPVEYLRTHFSSSGLTESGTFIRWTKLDCLTWKTGRAIRSHCENLVGRMYRKFMLADDDQRVRIASSVYRRDNGILSRQDSVDFKPNDPMYLMKGTSLPDLPGDYKGEAFFELAGNHTETITFTNAEGEEVTGEVKIVSSIVKTSISNHILSQSSKRLGATEWGKHCAKNMGVSIIRAGRELVLRDSFLPKKLRESKGRFIGVEVSFGPELDDIFGVTNNKQDAVKLKPYNIDRLKDEEQSVKDYRDELEEEGDSFVHVLRVVEAIDDTIKQLSSMLDKVKVDPITVIGDQDTSPSAIASKAAKIHEAKGNVMKPNPVPLDEEKVEAVLKENAIHTVTAKAVVDNDLRYLIGTQAQVDSDAFFSVSTQNGLTVTSFNTKHIFYNDIYLGMSEDVRKRFDLVIASFACVMNEERTSEKNIRILDDVRKRWGKAVTDFLCEDEDDDCDI